VAERRADVSASSEVDGRAFLRKALEQLPPVRQLFVDFCEIGTKERMALPEPVVPEGIRVSECRKVDRDGLHRSRSRSQMSIPSDSPTASIATSTGEAWRPTTKCWWTSSVAA